MTPEKAKELKAYLQAIAAILYEETPPEKLDTLEQIEQTVRQEVFKHVKLVGRKLPPHRLYVSPEIGVLFIQAVTGTRAGRKRWLKSSICILKLTENQAKQLDVEPKSL